MIKSMTGFGSASRQVDGRTITVEVKSVNNRFREVVTRLPKVCIPLEESIKKLVATKVERGRIDLWVQLDDGALKAQALGINLPLADQLHALLSELKERFQLDSAISLDQLISLGVIAAQENVVALDELWSALEPLILEAVESLVVMRQAEGENLLADFNTRLKRLSESNKKIEELTSSAADVLLLKLQKRLDELGTGVKVEQARLAQEVALLADRADITEEIVRFASHLERFHTILDDKETAGRRLDFLLQEMGREVNTMGSKSQDLEVTGLVLDMKAELEKLREQVQNIE